MKHLLRDWVQPIVLGRTWRTCWPVAAVVGSLLIALNEGSIIVEGHIDATVLSRAVLNYLVPYTVSSIGYLKARREDQQVGPLPPPAIK